MSASLSEGRLTIRGSAAIEAELACVLARSAEVARSVVPPKLLRALVLLGGYGRGEGGVDRSSGRERPHNNLDLLLVLRHVPVVGPALARRLAGDLAHALGPLGRASGVGIDVGAITDRRLAGARCLVMWSDMRQGHRVVAGDARFVSDLSRFEPSRVERDDVLALLVNRATLLLVNRALMARTRGDAEVLVRRTVVRHAMKAVVGAGDALLFTRGLYDGSYLEKRRRLASLVDVDAELRSWYERAIEFRLEPDYGRLPRDLEAWNRDLLALVATVHHRFESERLGRASVSGWDGYFQTAAAEAALGATRTLRDRVRVARDRRDLRSVPGLGWREVLPLLFPLVAYRTDAALAGRLLRSADTDEGPLDLAYLRAWGRHCDPAFARVARDLGLDVSTRRTK